MGEHCFTIQCPVRMFRPILLLLLACMAVTLTMATEDMEDMMEDMMEDREDMLEVEDRDALADIEDVEEAEEIEESATDEELDDREAMVEDRAGREISPAVDVDCGKWTNVVVDINNDTESTLKTNKYTMRCTVLYRLTNNSCDEMQLTCSKFFVDNRDPYLCRVGDAFYTRPSMTVPRAFCKQDGPTYHFPVVSKSEMKVWYKRSIGVLGLGRYPNKGVRCKVTCSKPVA